MLVTSMLVIFESSCPIPFFPSMVLLVVKKHWSWNGNSDSSLCFSSLRSKRKGRRGLLYSNLRVTLIYLALYAPGNLHRVSVDHESSFLCSFDVNWCFIYISFSVSSAIRHRFYCMNRFLFLSNEITSLVKLTALNDLFRFTSDNFVNFSHINTLEICC